MKKSILILIVAFGLTSFFQSCKKDSTIASDKNKINVSLKVNQSYQYDLGGFGIEEGAGIATQASHFLVSIAYRDTSGMTPNIFYKYTPQANFVGTDSVILKSARGSNGVSVNTNISYTNIKFTITN